MSTEPEKTSETTLQKSIAKNSLTLGLFAILTVGLIAGTYVFTKDRITAQIRAYEAKALKEILPDTEHDNELLDTRVTLAPSELLATSEEKDAYIGFKAGEPVAVIIPTIAPDGYNGRIDLLVGIYEDGSLAGVRATNHKETPGLGDKIETKVTDWILGFRGKSLDDPKGKGWGVKKDGGQFDQFTGATITPRAVVASVHRTLNYFKDNKDRLFKEGRQALKAHKGDSNDG